MALGVGLCRRYGAKLLGQIEDPARAVRNRYQVRFLAEAPAQRESPPGGERRESDDLKDSKEWRAACHTRSKGEESIWSG